MQDSKMSKSLGNIILIKDLLADMHGEVIRLALMSSHYRQPLKWTNDLVKQSKKTLNNMYSFLEKNEDIDIVETDINMDMLFALSDDLNTPKAVSVLHSIFKKLKKDPNNIELRSSFVRSANFMGLLLVKPSNWGKKDDDEINEQLIDELVNERNKARKAKDFVLADEIRDRLLNLDIILEDKDSITRWKKKND